jgi:hypothetical protein
MWSAIRRPSHPLHPGNPIHHRFSRASDGLGRRVGYPPAPTRPIAGPAETVMNGIFRMKGMGLDQNLVDLPLLIKLSKIKYLNRSAW